MNSNELVRFLSGLLEETAIDPNNVTIEQDNARPKAETRFKHHQRHASEIQRQCRWSETDKDTSSPVQPIRQAFPLPKSGSDSPVSRMPLKSNSPPPAPTRIVTASTPSWERSTKTEKREAVSNLIPSSIPFQGNCQPAFKGNTTVSRSWEKMIKLRTTKMDTIELFSPLLASPKSMGPIRIWRRLRPHFIVIKVKTTACSRILNLYRDRRTTK